MADEPRDPETPQDPPTGPTEPLTSGDPLGAGPERPHEPPRADEPPPASGPPPRRLTRSSEDRLIGGVAGGLGRYFGIDPIIVRIAFVVLCFFGGVGVLAYIGLLAFVPADGPPGPQQNRLLAIVGAVALGVAALVLIGGPVFFLGPILLPLALVVLVGVLLWRAAGGGGLEGDPARVIGRIVLAGLLGIAAIGAFFGVGAAAAFGGDVVLAALAIAAGVVLIATAFVGGARWMIVPALVLVLPLAIVAAADLSLDGGVGDREYRPGTMSELRDRYEIGAGQLIVDLRDVDLPAGRTDVAVDVGVGEALVFVPDDACVSADVRIGIGHAQVLGRDSDGVDVAYAASAPRDPAAPEVHVDADMGIGALQVRRGGDELDLGFDHGERWLDMPVEAACP
jgi:phage shock protein PspC (stress-responsive transcriptional regulator)